MIRFGIHLAAAAFAAATIFPLTADAVTLYGSVFTVGRGPSSLYTINQANGSGTLVGAIGLDGVGAMDIGPNGTLYGAAYVSDPNDSELIRINPATGQGTPIGFMGVIGNVQDMTFRPSDGKLFVYSEGNIFTINTNTGVGTFVGRPESFPDGNGLAFSGNTLYLANDSGSAPGTLWTINQSTGAQTSVATLSYAGSFVGATPRINAMKVDSGGTVWVSVQTGDRPTTVNYIGHLNLATGAVSFVGPTTSGLDGIAIGNATGTTSVPALSDWSLLATIIALGLAGMWLVSRKRVNA